MPSSGRNLSPATRAILHCACSGFFYYLARIFDDPFDSISLQQASLSKSEHLAHRPPTRTLCLPQAFRTCRQLSLSGWWIRQGGHACRTRGGVDERRRRQEKPCERSKVEDGATGDEVVRGTTDQHNAQEQAGS